MISNFLWFFLAVAMVLALQLYYAARQSQAFMVEVRRLRAQGTVAIGLHGRTWFGRRAYVALTVDRDGDVVDAIVLRGLTQFARPKPAPAFVGHRVTELAGDAPGPAVDRTLRGAARQAAQTLCASGGWQPTGGAEQGKESAQPASSHLN